MSVIFSLCLYPDCQVVLVELLVAMVSQRITADELALLIRLFLEKTAPVVSLKPRHVDHLQKTPFYFFHTIIIFFNYFLKYIYIYIQGL